MPRDWKTPVPHSSSEKPNKRFSRLVPFLPILLSLIVISFLLPWFKRLDLRFLDYSFQLRSPLNLARPLAKEILLLELDNRDLQEIGKDGEYAVAAEVIEGMAKLGARAVAVDVLFSRGSEEEQQLIRKAIDEAKAQFRMEVVLPAMIQSKIDEPGLLTSLPLAGGFELRQGIINMQIDRDRIWRHYSLTHFLGGATFSSLALAAYDTTLPEGQGLQPGPTPGTFQWEELQDDFVTLRSRTVSDRSLLLNIPHSYFSDKVDRLSGNGRRVWNLRDFHTLLQENTEGGMSPFHGSVVFLGYSAGLDEKATSMGPQEPGVFLHAVALSNLIQDRFITQGSAALDIAMLALFGMIAHFILSTSRSKRTLVAALILGTIIILGSSLCSIWMLEFLPGVTAPLFFWITLVAVRLSQLHTDELFERRHLDKMVSYYFSPNVLKHVRENPGATDPKEAHLTILLTDLRKFTNLCERLTPRKMFRLLGEIFEIQTTEAMAEDGSLQHFWGDQFIAYWGAPEPQVDSADRAFRAAESIAREINNYRADLPAKFQEEFDIGIGLHSGPGLVGNMGSQTYLDYCIFGDVVNATARLETLTKRYGVRALASRQFVDELSKKSSFRQIDEVFVSGKSITSLTLYEIRFPFDPELPRDLVHQYGYAFAKYQSGEFAEAREIFLQTFQKYKDPPSKTLAERCEYLAVNPPEDWQGIYQFEEK